MIALRYFFSVIIVTQIRAGSNQTGPSESSKYENKEANDTNINESISQSATTGNFSLSKRDIFYAGFQVKRVHQLAAAKQLVTIKDYSKQYKLVKVLTEKLFQVLATSKIVITQSSYIPGQNFPEKEEDLNALAHVVENTAFFGDILLRLPDITHKILKAKREWEIIINWSIGFCNETGIFDKANQKLLNLVAQELELIPRDPAYINPYKAETLLKETEKSQVSNNKSKKKLKKRKGKARKGPRLSRSDL